MAQTNSENTNSFFSSSEASFPFPKRKRNESTEAYFESEFCNCAKRFSLALLNENEVPDLMTMHIRIENLYLTFKHFSSNHDVSTQQSSANSNSENRCLSKEELKLFDKICFFRIFSESLVRDFCKNLQTPIDHILLVSNDKKCTTHSVLFRQREIVFKFWKYFAIVFEHLIDHGAQREKQSHNFDHRRGSASATSAHSSLPLVKPTSRPNSSARENHHHHHHLNSSERTTGKFSMPTAFQSKPDPMTKLFASANSDCDAFSFFFSQSYDSVLTALAKETSFQADYSTVFKNSSFVLNPCNNCGSQKPLVSNGQTCGNCATELCQISHSFNFNDSCRVFRNNKPVYDRKFVFKECLLRFQAKQKTFLPIKVLRAVEIILINRGLARSDETNENRIVIDDQVSCRDVHHALETLHLSEFSDDIVLIWCKLTGGKADDVSRLESIIMDDFDIVLSVHQSMERCEKRKSFVNAHFLLFQLLKRKDVLIKNFYFFNSCFDHEKRKQSEMLCSKLFNVLDWKLFDFEEARNSQPFVQATTTTKQPRLKRNKKDEQCSVEV